MGHLVDEPKLGDSLDFMRTVWEVDHALNGLSRAMEGHLGLTGPQRLVLRVIGRMPGISAGTLAAALHLDPSTLTGHLKRLVRAGLVIRRPAKDDRRRVELRLAANGRAMDVAMPGTVEAAVGDLKGAFDTEELELARRVFAKLAQALQKQSAAVADRPRSRRRTNGAARNT